MADAAIAFGIVGEVLFGSKDARIQTELRNRSNKKLARAIERAAAAELETQRLRAHLAWRAISQEGANKLMFALSLNKGSVTIE